MRRRILLLAMLGIGCSHARRSMRATETARALQRYVGAHISYALEDFGPVTETHPTGATTLYVWRYSAQMVSRSDAQTTASRLFGVMTDSSTTSGIEECRFWFVVDAAGIIQNWRARGDCDLSELAGGSGSATEPDPALPAGLKEVPRGGPCRDDSDCKGFQICEKRECRDP